MCMINGICFRKHLRLNNLAETSASGKYNDFSGACYGGGGKMFKVLSFNHTQKCKS